MGRARKFLESFAEAKGDMKKIMNMRYGKSGYEVDIFTDKNGKKVKAIFRGFAEPANNGEYSIIGKMADRWLPNITQEFRQRMETTGDGQTRWNSRELKTTDFREYDESLQKVNEASKSKIDVKAIEKEWDKIDDAWDVAKDTRKLQEMVQGVDSELEQLVSDFEDAIWSKEAINLAIKIRKGMAELKAKLGELVGPKKGMAELQKMYKMLEKEAKSKKLPGIEVIAKQYSEPWEDSKGYKYPESIDVKFQNWSNHFFTYRLKENDFIPEGVKLSSKKGLSAKELVKQMADEMAEWKKERLEDYPDDEKRFLKDNKMQFIDKTGEI